MIKEYFRWLTKSKKKNTKEALYEFVSKEFFKQEIDTRLISSTPKMLAEIFWQLALLKKEINNMKK